MSKIRSIVIRLAAAAMKAGIRYPHTELAAKFNEMAFLVDLLAKLRVNCFLDIGANKGELAKRLRMAGYKGRIVSFEPNRGDCAFIERLAARDPAWRVYPVGLGSENAVRPFHIIDAGANRTDLSSFLDFDAEAHERLTRDGAPALARTEEVEIKRLDSIFGELVEGIDEPRVFLKVDTQGFDLEVIKGAAGCLDRILGFRSEISVEPIYKDSPHYTEVLAYYESLGFKLMDLFVVNRTASGGILEYDCIMVRESGG